MKDWINLITFLSEKTLKQSLIDKETDEEEVLELKRLNYHYLDKRKRFMNNTQFKVEIIFGDVKSRDSFSSERKPKPNRFLAKVM